MQTVCKVIQSGSQSKDSHEGAQRGETTPVHTMCKVIQCSIQSKDSHDGTQRGETTPVHNMHLFMQHCQRPQAAPYNPHRSEAI